MVFRFSACALPDCERLPVRYTQTGSFNFLIFLNKKEEVFY